MLSSAVKYDYFHAFIVLDMFTPSNRSLLLVTDHLAIESFVSKYYIRQV